MLRVEDQEAATTERSFTYMKALVLVRCPMMSHDVPWSKRQGISSPSIGPRSSRMLRAPWPQNTGRNFRGSLVGGKGRRRWDKEGFDAAVAHTSCVVLQVWIQALGLTYFRQRSSGTLTGTVHSEPFLAELLPFFGFHLPFRPCIASGLDVCHGRLQSEDSSENDNLRRSSFLVSSSGDRDGNNFDFPDAACLHSAPHSFLRFFSIPAPSFGPLVLVISGASPVRGPRHPECHPCRWCSCARLGRTEQNGSQNGSACRLAGFSAITDKWNRSRNRTPWNHAFSELSLLIAP